MIPTFPSDATIPSILVAFSRSGAINNPQAISTAVEYQKAHHPSNRFGYKAWPIAELTFGNAAYAIDLVTKHSMFNLIANYWYPSSDLIPLAKSVAKGHKYLNHTGLETLEGMRQCPACVATSFDTFGTGHWLVSHQIPSIRHCPHHWELLHDQCKCCSAPLGRAGLVLPGDPCDSCGSRRTKSSLSTHNALGYRSYVSALMRALDNKAPELSGHSYSSILKILRAVHCSSDLMDRLLAWWGVLSIGQLALLVQPNTAKKPRKELFESEFLPSGTGLLMRAAVLAFAWKDVPERDRVQLTRSWSRRRTLA